MNVAVLLDEPRPEGSTGVTEAVLALHYDPSAVSVSAADITLGSLTSGGSRQLRAVVDQLTGEIGIELWSDTPITANDAGSLVNIDFHPRTTAAASTTVRLVDKTSPGGETFTILLADSLGSLVPSPGIDQIVIPLK